MNAPDRLKPLALIVGLIGLPGSGRDEVARILKHDHGLATARLDQPLNDAVGVLYGVTPADRLFSPTTPLARWNKSAQELISGLRDHVEASVGRDFLHHRLVERTVARGEWHQDLAVLDIATAADIAWLRSLGGIPWWIRKPAATVDQYLDPIQQLGLTEWRPTDCSILHDGSNEALMFKVDSLVERLRRAAAITP